jgi:diamine N-acetyltransferase
MNVHLREITADNFVEAMRLKVKPEQAEHVATNAASIAQSKFHTFLACYGIYDGAVMVGFTACGRNPEDGTVWIVRHMIGEQFQGLGYGKAGLRSIVEHMTREYGSTSVFLDVVPANAAAIGLYEGAGFRDTGKIQGHSKVYRLDTA